MYINPINKPDIRIKKDLRKILQEEKLAEALIEDAVELTNFNEEKKKENSKNNSPSTKKDQQQTTGINIRV